MKKSLVIALALVFVLGIAGTAFAANPFVDVPAKHWAYGAVDQLYKAGLVDGVSAGKYMGDKTMTRYEMAQIVAKAIAKEDKADAAIKATIDKLAVEFAAELNNLGVRVAKLEKNASSIKFSGDARFRYTSNFSGDTLSGTTAPDRTQLRARIKMEANPADDVQFTGRISTQEKLMDVAAKTSNDQTEFDIMQFKFKNVFGWADLTLGRQYVFIGQGLMWDAPYYDAARVDFGNEVKVWLAYGDACNAPGPDASAKFDAKTEKMIKAANVSYNVSKDINVTASALYSATAAYHKNLLSFGTKAQLSPDFAFTGEYVKNNWKGIDTENTAIWTKLAYKGATNAVVGSYGLYVDYRKLGKETIDGFTTLNNNGAFLTGGTYADEGIKGIGYGLSYTVAKNSIFYFEVEPWKTTISNEKLATFYNARMQWVF